jgi:hypothetical protein
METVQSLTFKSDAFHRDIERLWELAANSEQFGSQSDDGNTLERIDTILTFCKQHEGEMLAVTAYKR